MGYLCDNTEHEAKMSIGRKTYSESSFCNSVVEWYNVLVPPYTVGKVYVV